MLKNLMDTPSQLEWVEKSLLCQESFLGICPGNCGKLHNSPSHINKFVVYQGKTWVKKNKNRKQQIYNWGHPKKFLMKYKDEEKNKKIHVVWKVEGDSLSIFVYNARYKSDIPKSNYILTNYKERVWLYSKYHSPETHKYNITRNLSPYLIDNVLKYFKAYPSEDRLKYKIDMQIDAINKVQEIKMRRNLENVKEQPDIDYDKLADLIIKKIISDNLTSSNNLIDLIAEKVLQKQNEKALTSNQSNHYTKRKLSDMEHNPDPRLQISTDSKKYYKKQSTEHNPDPRLQMQYKPKLTEHNPDPRLQISTDSKKYYKTQSTEQNPDPRLQMPIDSEKYKIQSVNDSYNTKERLEYYNS